ncbi:unnamed protein product [Parnassius apollo]|uniref:(apollo) hypothetical protein n=1 Tax=Parnassius apollo TaxID=110799 RepID=A0A8S3XK33_PARAO|nr:unnamed protein product [Parnassius apollo]
MGNTDNKDDAVIAQSEAAMKETIVRSYIGWAVAIFSITVMILYFFCRYGTAQVKKWVRKQMGFVQEQALQMTQATRASFRRAHDSHKMAD